MPHAHPSRHVKLSRRIELEICSPSQLAVLGLRVNEIRNLAVRRGLGRAAQDALIWGAIGLLCLLMWLGLDALKLITGRIVAGIIALVIVGFCVSVLRCPGSSRRT